MRKYLTALLAVALLAGCATTTGTPNPRDPWEPFNRSMFQFNDNLDSTIVKPVVNVYTAVFPSFVRTGVSNFFSNVGDVWVGVNNLLQGKPDQAVSDIGRVLVNSTIGLFGLVDVASDMGLQHHNEDFGQTLGRWGMGPGPYMVLPVFGPRDVRDSFGLVADVYGNPIGYMHDVGWRNSLWGVSFLDARANLNDASNLLDTAALDRYTFVRESYLQRRRNLVYDGDPPPLPPSHDDEDTAPDPKAKVSQLPAAADEATAATPEVVAAADTPVAKAGPAVPANAVPAPDSSAADKAAAKSQARNVVYPVAVPAIPDRVTDQ
jgi:phospholipid-binding lipoprotein MlaA